jgi:beta-lactamase class A
MTARTAGLLACLASAGAPGGGHFSGAGAGPPLSSGREAVGSPASVDQSQVGPLQVELKRIADSAPAKVGIGVIHVETGREVFVNRAEWFPMASTYKIPMAVEVLTRVDRRELRLDSLVPIEPSDVVPFGSLLTERFGEGDSPGAALSVRRYLELMLILSDNTATDVLLRLIGGPKSVQARLGALGIRDMEVSRSVNELGAAFFGFPTPPPSQRTIKSMRALMAKATPDQMKAAKQAFFASRSDHATPEAMARLLAKVVRGEAVSRASTDLLYSIMLREETGDARIRGRLPLGVKAGNKTGTLDVTVHNDVGIVFLPDGTHLVIAVYLKEARTPGAPLDRVIADVARSASDYFVMAR